ncbi:MAG: sigma-70 family RNA polymerase sigma factor [Synechococcales cyanobacterium C42_A2020_086]|jgi:RNA polymerase sigma-70 factor (ECF subfamily)|nr:sigma-70 family RNA polymerase sigma factor [Synechococcales cyanobacterium C42_A2020_086]
MTPSSQDDDVVLLQRIGQRDQVALSKLYDRYARVIYAVAHKSLNSAEEAEEVVLDVFTQVWQIAVHYDAQKARVDTWLFMLTRSRILDRLRKLQRTARETIASLTAHGQSPMQTHDPVEEAVIAERRLRMQTALNRLPQEQRQLIELAYYQGLSHREIAAQTNLPLGTVKTRIRLGLTKLRMLLGS